VGPELSRRYGEEKQIYFCLDAGERIKACAPTRNPTRDVDTASAKISPLLRLVDDNFSEIYFKEFCCSLHTGTNA
jgi:hypothetical protein